MFATLAMLLIGILLPLAPANALGCVCGSGGGGGTYVPPPPTYVATFDAQGAVNPPPQTVTENNTITEPPTPFRAGYTFTGWYTAAGALYDFATPMTGPITLYAQWVRTQYQVGYDSQGGTPVQSVLVFAGDPAPVPTPPTRTGYTFTGWTTANRVAYDFTTPVTSRTILYASWAPNTYTLTLDYQDNSSPVLQSLLYGTTATEPAAPTWPNLEYLFSGWSTAPSGGSAWDWSTAITTSLTLYANWIKNMMPVTFDSQGGTTVPPDTAWWGHPVARPADPTRTGYTFDGWTRTGATVWNFDNPIIAAVTLKAMWTQHIYAVSFDTTGGSSIADQSVGYGDPAKAPANPTRTGYTFYGWFTAPTGGTAYDFATPVTGATTIHAQWSQNSYPFAFDATSATSGAVAEQPVGYGDSATAPAAPWRIGYTFAGWYTAPTGGTAYDFATPVTGATTVYAQWTQRIYPVTFGSEGGESIADQLVGYGDLATVPTDPTRTGYTFTGWYTAPEGAGGHLWDFSAPVTGSTDLYAHWSVNTYTVSFDEAGGTAVIVQRIDYGNPAAVPTDPTRTGYTFTGWYTAATGGHLWNFLDPITDTTTIHAQWSQNRYPVTFDSLGGGPVADQSVLHGDSATVPTDPRRTGHTFTGWFTDPTGGTSWDFSASVTNTTNLYAHWTVDTYTATFDAQGGTAVPDQRIDYSDLAAEPPVPTRTGYTFTGWFTAPTGGTVWDFTDPVTGTTNLYARWSHNSYSVTFDTTDGAVPDQSVLHGDPAVVPTDPTRTGYTFTGWFTAPTGGDRWDFTAPIVEEVTLYAHWALSPLDHDGSTTGQGNQHNGHHTDAGHGAASMGKDRSPAGLADTGSNVPFGTVPTALLLLLLGAWLVRRSNVMPR